MKLLPVILVLSGCTTGPMVPEGTDYVRLSSVGSSPGRSSDTIFANDKLRREVAVGNASQTRVSWAALPDGTYAQARAIAERGLPQISSAARCPADAPLRRLDVSPPVEGIVSVEATCGLDAMDRALMPLLPPWRQRVSG